MMTANKGHGLTQWHSESFTPDIDTMHTNPAIDSKDGKIQILWDNFDHPDGTGLVAPQKGGRYKEQFDWKGRKAAHCPNDWKDLQPIAVWHPSYNAFESFPINRRKDYPLYLLTNKSRYAIHYLMGDPGNPRIRDVKRHGLWINATDAKMRGIKDHDAVRIYNTTADGSHEWPDPLTTLNQVVIRAYVTNRIMPGIALMRTGNKANYGPSGVRLDMNLGPEVQSGGATNQFTGGDDTSPISPAKVTNMVQVELFAKGPWYRRD
jgi:anaerobic selenocysteine-containing dehydrogenase